jgi:hypothetical protein
MFSDKKHREALDLIASLEKRVSELSRRLELLAEATGHVYVAQRRATVPPACYAPKDSELAKEYKSFMDESIKARQSTQGRGVIFGMNGWIE